MGRGSGRLRRSDRLLLSRDFQRVSRTGRRLASRNFVVLIAPMPESRVSAGVRGASRPLRRLGITASRKVGNAVVRNRIKRGIRDWFREHRVGLDAEIDIVVIARRGARELRAVEIDEQLSRLLDLGREDDS